MTLREIYIEAARRIAQGEGYCVCNTLYNMRQHRAQLLFADIFRPRTSCEQAGFLMGRGTAWLERHDDTLSTARHRRVMALLLAAEAIGGEE